MRCLLITPKHFYTFHDFLSEELVCRGFEVDVVNDEYPENIVGQLLGNFLPYLSKLITFKFMQKHLAKHSEYDLVIIMKGRGISVKTVNLIKKHTKRIIGYNFDSFRYNSSPLKWMKIVDKYATFDHLDSKDYNIEKIELFSSAPNIEPAVKTIDLSVVLKNHSDRLLYLDQISRLFPRITSEIFIYEKNLFTFVRNVLVHPRLVFKWRKYISFKPLDYSSYLNLINRSMYTLDFAHPKQSGTTKRCFEALACGTKIITDNNYVLANPIFNESNVIIHLLNGCAENLFELMKEKSKIHGEFETRTVGDFIDELLQ